MHGRCETAVSPGSEVWRHYSCRGLGLLHYTPRSNLMPPLCGPKAGGIACRKKILPASGLQGLGALLKDIEEERDHDLASLPR